MSKYVIFVMLILTQISVPHPKRVYKLTIHILHTDYTYYYISFRYTPVIQDLGNLFVITVNILVLVVVVVVLLLFLL